VNRTFSQGEVNSELSSPNQAVTKSSQSARISMQPAARVIVASQRASAGVYPDTTGPLIASWLKDHGYQVTDPLVVPDGEPVGRALRQCIAEQVQVVITTGGTGISPTDRTPEYTAGVVDYQLPGIAEAIRLTGLAKVPTAALSRGIAGVAGRTLVVNFPGSRGGVKDGLAVLEGILGHAVDQLQGGDHERSAAQDSSSDVSATVVVTSDVRIARAAVTEKPLIVEEHAKLVDDRGAGAVVTFTGVVRDHDGGKSVNSLYYEGHPTASEVLLTVVSELIASRGLRAVAVSHRVGALKIGDIALVCAVSADHRAEAFNVCAELIDEIKARLPIWKNQHFTDGTEEWVNSP